MIGWMSKGMLERVASEIAEKAITTHLRAELAAERARVDWFMQHINELKVERAALYARIGVHLPVATIQRVDGAPPLPGMDDGYAPPTGPGADFGNLLATARDLREKGEKARVAPAGMPDAIFEDVGDEIAEAIGATNREDGTLAYTR